MIPEPQLTYVLELLKALGPAAEDFVIAGAQAIKFMLKVEAKMSLKKAGRRALVEEVRA